MQFHFVLINIQTTHIGRACDLVSYLGYVVGYARMVGSQGSSLLRSVAEVMLPVTLTIP